jgi:Zn-dependent peptidase ImmA (M78 family)/transcriptional regulator with XRE-family HTH domain
MAVMPVKTALLVWAREHRGLSVEEAADLLSMTPAELAALEGGKPVNLTTFRKIAKRYHIPAATLLRSTRPAVPPMPRDFRTFEGRPPRTSFEPRLAIRYARTSAQNILELVDANAAPATPVLTRLRLTDNAGEAGERERERLGVSTATQLAWSYQEAFNNWRSVIERTGTYVLMPKFPLDDCKGFTLYDNPNAPILVLSKEEDYEPARIYTLIHEYCHLLLREPGLSDLNRRDPVEVFCNKFAAGFLMPRTALRAILPTWPNRPVEWGREDIIVWARKLKVSQQALAFRLQGLGVAPEGFGARFSARQAKRKRLEDQRGNYLNTTMSELGMRYLGVVLSAVEARDIQDAEAAEMTHLAPKHFPHVRAQVDRRAQRIGAIGSGVPH